MSTKYITIGTVEFPLWLDPGHNDPCNNERMVELPLAWWFLELMHEHHPYMRGFEVGAVTPYYPKCTNKVEPRSGWEPGHEPPIGPEARRFRGHLVVDPYDGHPLAQKLCAQDLRYKDHWLLSISTVEHMGTGEYGPQSDAGPLFVFNQICRMRQAWHYLITWPTGFNTNLDALDEVIGDWDDVILLKRTGSQAWQRVKKWGMYGPPAYNAPHPCGNGLYIVTNCQELLQCSD